MRKFIFILLLCILPTTKAVSAVLTKDTLWQGAVSISDDILVPAGVTLTIAAGTTINVSPAESTKIDPEYLSHYTEILVRGTLRAAGSVLQPITFQLLHTAGSEGRWAGIIVDHGEAYLTGIVIDNAEAGLYVINGKLEMDASKLLKNRYGVVAQGETTAINIKNSTFIENEYGLFTFGKVSLKTDQVTFKGTGKKDIHAAGSMAGVLRNVREYQLDSQKAITRIYQDEALVGQTVWKGRVVIDGIVRVPPEARLIVLPGTLVELRKKDTNGDGIGENGLLVQGNFIAKGTPQQPIIFRSAETTRNMGDWDSINILGSDRRQNIIEFCQFEDAYRALHFHFSNVAVNNVVMRNNYRGAQFQESLVEIRESSFYNNKSGIQARDSESLFSGNLVADNHTGANFFRMNMEVSGNTFANNNLEGLKLREGTPRVTKNRFMGNRYGLLVADAVFGDYRENLIAGNYESGISLRNSDHIRVAANFIQQNAINGINIQDSRISIQGNLISSNGERGIGVRSFTGKIEENNITDNGRYGIGLDGLGDVAAMNNWWGDSDMDAELFDSHDDSRLGTVTYQPQSRSPFEIVWPFTNIVSGISWAGAIGVPDIVEIEVGAVLNILPGTSIYFGPEGGLHSHGRITANGTKTNRIQFLPHENRGRGSWGELLIEQGDASSFSFCDFSDATWGLHLHLTKVEVDNCLFTDNDGGLRFRSGPVTIARSIFKNNRIAIRSYRGVGTIEHSDIFENEIGIFIRERGGAFIIHKNNLHDNERYNLRLGDFNTENVDARQNWWGTAQPLETIFDDRREPGVGRVDFDPFALEPLPILVEQ
jgi:hypothetical protein